MTNALVPETNGHGQIGGNTTENRTSFPDTGVIEIPSHTVDTQKTLASKSDSESLSSAQIATERNNGNRKMGRAPLTSPAYTASSENAFHTGDKPIQPLMAGLDAHTSESNSVGDSVSSVKGSNPLAGTLFHNAHISQPHYKCTCRLSQMSHFATFPEELPERCIKAGTPEYGCCDKCGKPYERIVEVFPTAHDGLTFNKARNDPQDNGNRLALVRQHIRELGMESVPPPKTLGWKQACACADSKPMPSVCLDPFAGSGTTLWVAKRLNRKAVGYELSAEYCELIKDRNRQQVLC